MTSRTGLALALTVVTVLAVGGGADCCCLAGSCWGGLCLEVIPIVVFSDVEICEFVRFVFKVDAVALLLAPLIFFVDDEVVAVEVVDVGAGVGLDLVPKIGITSKYWQEFRKEKNKINGKKLKYLKIYLSDKNIKV